MKDISMIQIVPLNSDGEEEEESVIFIAERFAKNRIREIFEHEVLYYNDVGIPGGRMKELIFLALGECKSYYTGSKPDAPKNIFDQSIEIINSQCDKINKEKRYRIVKIQDEDELTEYETEYKKEKEQNEFIKGILNFFKKLKI